MSLDHASCYRALQAHDRRFDGKFFVGVSSTGIYCRPVCTVRSPRPENCRFFASAAAAEVEGYRPCLRCRPELAPGNAGVDATARLAQAAVSLIENGVLDDGGIEALAARIGVTSRHLRRIFDAEFGVSPVEYAQTQRLLLAKRLLTDTALPVTEVALASGFASVRRFNALWKERYRMPPSRVRRDGAARALPARLEFELAYRPPYDWDSMLSFLEARAIAGVEDVRSGAYRRTLVVTQRGAAHVGWIEVRRAPRKTALAVAVSPSLARVTPAVLALVKQAFDLSCDPALVAVRAGRTGAAAPRPARAGELRRLRARRARGRRPADHGARRADAAGAHRRSVRRGGRGADGRPRPGPAVSVGGADRRRRRARARPPRHHRRARAHAGRPSPRAVAEGGLRLAPGVDVEATVRALEALPGVGPWTAQYVALRALAWPDAFPASDLVVLKALGETRPARALVRSEAWRPWRAYAVLHLWRNAT